VGSLYKPGSEVNNTHLLGQQATMRDAVLAGISLDTFHKHADKVAMANIAQLINCLQALFLAHEDKFILTPTYHVFDMYTAHQGAQSLRTMVSAPRLPYTRNQKPATLRGLSASSSLRDKELTVTVTNPDISQTRETEISLRGANIKAIKVTTLTASDIHAHNSFANPRQIEPKESELTPKSGVLVHRFAPASVTKLQITLA
jgi:alpha-L-arabinofuranosidase